MEASKAVSDEWSQKFAQLELSYQAELAKRMPRLPGCANRLSACRTMKPDLKEKRQACPSTRTGAPKLRAAAPSQGQRVDYLKRKLTRPEKHIDVIEWARRQFSDRLVMHKRTETLLAKKTAWGVDLDLLCDALDFLATDYWDYRFSQLPKEEMNRRCSVKYGRPFEVSKLGDLTVEFTPSEYKVKYKMTGTEKAREYALNWHLKVGNDPENLLRIYFSPMTRPKSW